MTYNFDNFNEFALTECCHKHCSTHKSHCDNFFS